MQKLRSPGLWVKKSRPGRVKKKSGSKNSGSKKPGRAGSIKKSRSKNPGRAGSKKNPGQKIRAGPGQKIHGPVGGCAPHTPCTCGGCAPTPPLLASTVNQNTARVLAVLVFTDTARALAVSVFHRHSKDQIEVARPWKLKDGHVHGQTDSGE